MLDTLRPVEDEELPPDVDDDITPTPILQEGGTPPGGAGPLPRAADILDLPFRGRKGLRNGKYGDPQADAMWDWCTKSKKRGPPTLDEVPEIERGRGSTAKTDRSGSASALSAGAGAAAAAACDLARVQSARVGPGG